MHLGEEDGLNKLIEEAYGAAPTKTEFMDSVKTHPSVITHCSIGSSFMDGYKDCLSRFSPETDTWTVRVCSTLGSEALLVGDAEAMRAPVRELLASYRRPARPTPEKVLAKMAALRLEKVLEAVRANQAFVDRDRKDLEKRLEDPKWGTVDGKDLHRDGTLRRIREMQDWPLPDLAATDRQALVAWCRSCKSRDGGKQTLYQELENVLMREDATEEVLRTACNAVLVKEVMVS